MPSEHNRRMVVTPPLSREECCYVSPGDGGLCLHTVRTSDLKRPEPEAMSILPALVRQGTQCPSPVFQGESLDGVVTPAKAAQPVIRTCPLPPRQTQGRDLLVVGGDTSCLWSHVDDIHSDGPAHRPQDSLIKERQRVGACESLGGAVEGVTLLTAAPDHFEARIESLRLEVVLAHVGVVLGHHVSTSGGCRGVSCVNVTERENKSIGLLTGTGDREYVRPGQEPWTAASVQVDLAGVQVDHAVTPVVDTPTPTDQGMDGMDETKQVSVSTATVDFWPEGVPRNYEELARDWGKHISNRVSRYNKIARNTEDLLQYIWMCLLKADFLKKYVAKLSTEPTELTALEACAYCGVNWNQWKTQMGFHFNGLPRGPVGEDGKRTRVYGSWMPKPIRGTITSQKAVFKFSDVVRVCAEGVFIKHGTVGTLPPIRSIDSNFVAYLNWSIHNHFCNFVRTKGRREQERSFDSFGIFHQRSDEEGTGRGWEELLEDEEVGDGTGIEVQVDVAIRLERVREHLGGHQEALMGHLSDGVTLHEAIQRLDITGPQRRHLLRQIEGLRAHYR